MLAPVQRPQSALDDGITGNKGNDVTNDRREKDKKCSRRQILTLISNNECDAFNDTRPHVLGAEM